MKKIFFLILLSAVTMSVQILAQEKAGSKWGFEYAFERIDPGVSDLHNPYHYYNQKKYIYVKDFNCHRVSLLYKQPIYGGFYVEPKLSYYYMEYCKAYHISIDPSVNVDRQYGVVLISDLEEYGLGASINLGYNFRLYNKWSVDFFVEPDYRYAMESKRPSGYNFLEVDKDFGVAVYDPGYLMLKGGVGVNYGALSLSFSYGKYVSDRFNINKDAMRPEVFTLALGFKFGR